MNVQRILVTGLCLLAAACERSTPPPESAPAPATRSVAPAPSWDAFVDEYIEGFLKAHPAQAVTAGRHEFDGQLPDWSAEGIAAEIERLHAFKRRALAFRDDALSAEQRYQRDYLVARVRRDLFWLDTAEWPFRNPSFYFDWLLDSLDPSAYVTLDYAPAEVRLAAITRYLNNIPTAATQIRSNLRSPMPGTYFDYGIASFGGLAAYYRNELGQAFAGVGEPAARESFEQARAEAATAMQALADSLIAERANATADYAIGPELFRQMLKETELVELSLAELEAIGWADLRRNQAALADACAELAPGVPLPDCFARMADNKPKGGAVEGARAQLEELKAFLIAQDLVSIPGTEEALVREAPPYARSNFAYINIPGPYEKNQPSIYFIAPPDPSWPEAEQRAYVPGEADLLFTSVHEVWPGHFLNFLHANRADWIFGRLFVGYAFAEGWAHYTEELMLEAGLRDRSPEVRIGQLSNALLRNARFLSTIGLHTKGMTVEESERLFREEAYQDAGTARQQAARGTYDPAYLNYTMGKLMIRQLREDWTARRGGRAAWKAFHDQFLSHGGPPIPLVRAQMLNGPVEAKLYVAKEFTQDAASAPD